MNRRAADIRRLVLASIHGYEDEVEQLLGSGIDPNSADRKGWTALHHAASAGSGCVVPVLLRAGADPCVRTQSGDTPLDFAVKKRFASITMALCRAGARWEDTRLSGSGRTAAHRAWLEHTAPLLDAVQRGDTDALLCCLDPGRNVNAMDAAGFPLLLIAARGGTVELVEALLASGADPNSEDRNRHWTALQQAADARNEPVVRLLIARGAALVPPPGRWAPLQSAALRGHVDIVEILLEAALGCGVALDNEQAARTAEQNGHAELARKLRRCALDDSEESRRS